MAVDLINANAYFETFVIDNTAWNSADEATKNRAIANASRMIERHYRKATIPDEAVYEQALWLLKLSEARKHSEQGVTSYSIDGISVSLSQVDRTFAPSVISILGRKVGRSLSGRQGYIVSDEDGVPGSGWL